MYTVFQFILEVKNLANLADSLENAKCFHHQPNFDCSMCPKTLIFPTITCFGSIRNYMYFHLQNKRVYGTSHTVHVLEVRLHH